MVGKVYTAPAGAKVVKNPRKFKIKIKPEHTRLGSNSSWSSGTPIAMAISEVMGGHPACSGPHCYVFVTRVGPDGRRKTTTITFRHNPAVKDIMERFDRGEAIEGSEIELEEAWVRTWP